MVGAWANKADNDVSGGDIITVCQLGEQKKFPVLPERSWQRERVKEMERAKIDVSILPLFSLILPLPFTYSNFPPFAL